jgi:hypothetical protein
MSHDSIIRILFYVACFLMVIVATFIGTNVIGIEWKDSKEQKKRTNNIIYLADALRLSAVILGIIEACLRK